MFKKVIFPIDLQHMENIEPYLKATEQLLDTVDAELRLISVLPGYTMPIVASHFPPNMLSKIRNEAGKELEDFIKKTLPSGLKVSYVVREGRPHEEIIAEAKQWEADLISIPSRVRSGIGASLIGSVAQRVTERAKCSVLVLRKNTLSLD